MTGVSKSTTKSFVEETINRYINTEIEIKKKYENSDSRCFIEDSMELRIQLLKRLKNDLMLDSDVIWGEEDNREKINSINDVLKEYHSGGYKTGFESFTVDTLFKIQKIVREE